MNRENLQKCAYHIATISQDVFEMSEFREDRKPETFKSIEYLGKQCGITHCLVLDDPGNIPRDEKGVIKMHTWITSFTGLPIDWISVSPGFLWCFGGSWSKVDNTPLGCSLRIEWLLREGLPKDWIEQIHGKAALCYTL